MVEKSRDNGDVHDSNNTTFNTENSSSPGPVNLEEMTTVVQGYLWNDQFPSKHVTVEVQVSIQSVLCVSLLNLLNTKSYVRV